VDGQGVVRQLNVTRLKRLEGETAREVWSRPKGSKTMVGEIERRKGVVKTLNSQNQ
jgi:hypothetical protein